MSGAPSGGSKGVSVPCYGPSSRCSSPALSEDDDASSSSSGKTVSTLPEEDELSWLASSCADRMAEQNARYAEACESAGGFAPAAMCDWASHPALACDAALAASNRAADACVVCWSLRVHASRDLGRYLAPALPVPAKSVVMILPPNKILTWGELET